MISVEFRSVGPGECQWCHKDKDEVFDVALSDKSFVGLYCRTDLMKAVTMKCARHGSSKGVSSGSSSTTNGHTVSESKTTTAQVGTSTSQSLGQGGPGISTTEAAKK